jgi:hypothetical protein
LGDGEGRDDLDPTLVDLGTLEVILEEEFLLLGDRRGRDGWELGGLCLGRKQADGKKREYS